MPRKCGPRCAPDIFSIRKKTRISAGFDIKSLRKLPF